MSVISEKESVLIREATADDAQRLLEIYAYYVEKTAITFEYDVPSVEEFRNRIENILKAYPYLVAEENGTIQGYAYAHVAGGGLQDGAARGDGAVAQGRAQQVQGHAVLDGAAGVAVFELHVDFAGKAGVKAGEVQEGGVPHCVEHVVKHGFVLL